MLRLLSLLQARRQWPGPDLAGRLGVSARTLRRDVDRLRELGYPVRARRGTDGGYELAAGAALLAAAQACRAAARVAFSYTARDGERSGREVEPHGLVLLGRCWYLVAWDLARHDWRTFRIDRMGAPRRCGPPFAPRRLPAAGPGAFVRDRIQALLAS
jgi:predicted DNA-binding transcriptional regulator YafY